MQNTSVPSSQPTFTEKDLCLLARTIGTPINPQALAKLNEGIDRIDRAHLEKLRTESALPKSAASS